MRPGDLRSLGTCRTGGRPARVLVPLLLVAILALAPALDLAGDGQAGSSNGPVNVLDLCSVPGMTASPAVLAPLVVIAGVTDTLSSGVASPLARPLDHPPQLA